MYLGYTKDQISHAMTDSGKTLLNEMGYKYLEIVKNDPIGKLEWVEKMKKGGEVIKTAFVWQLDSEKYLRVGFSDNVWGHGSRTIVQSNLLG